MCTGRPSAVRKNSFSRKRDTGQSGADTKRGAGQPKVATGSGSGGLSSPEGGYFGKQAQGRSIFMVCILLNFKSNFKWFTVRNEDSKVRLA